MYSGNFIFHVWKNGPGELWVRWRGAAGLLELGAD